MLRDVIATSSLLLILGCSTDGARDVRSFPRDAFPPGPYGNEEGATLKNHVFTTTDGGALSLQDVRADEDATLLLAVTAAGWCTACIEEQPSLQRLHDDHETDGLRIIVTVFEDSEFAPAQRTDAAKWQADHALTFPVVADPEFQLRDYYDVSLTPMNMLIDLGPMTIKRVTTGWDPSLIESLVEALL